MSAPDWVFPVRPGSSNEELKFALRSLCNVPHGTVWMVGHKPPWVTNVEYIGGGNSAPAPRANLYNNLLLACRQPGMSDAIVITNDDIYITEPISVAPILFRGTLRAQIAQVTRLAGSRGWWQESLTAALKALTECGHPDPLSYELHTPYPCDRHAMADTLERFAAVTPHNPPQWRTLHGVTHGIGGSLGPDVKALRPGPLRQPFHSTDDLSLRYFRAKLLALFPQPSPYEIPQVDARSLVNVPPRKHLRTARRARA